MASPPPPAQTHTFPGLGVTWFGAGALWASVVEALRERGGLSLHAWRSYRKGTCGHGTCTMWAVPHEGAGGDPGPPRVTATRSWTEAGSGQPPAASGGARLPAPAAATADTRPAAPAPRAGPAGAAPEARAGGGSQRRGPCGVPVLAGGCRRPASAGSGCEFVGRGPTVAETRGRARCHSPWSEDAPSKPQARRVSSLRPGTQATPRVV